MKIKMAPKHHFELKPNHARPSKPWGHTRPIAELSPVEIRKLNGELKLNAELNASRIVNRSGGYRADLSSPAVDPLNGLLPSDKPRARPKPIAWLGGPTPKDRARKAASRRGGLRAAANMTPKQRSERARKAVQAYWRQRSKTKT